jgi:ATP-dependent exoDNAse (exonuclease V) alpha subunit
MAEKEFGSAAGQPRLGQMQAEAVRQAMKCKVLIVTGGPGVGKTTAISSIVGSFRRLRVETVVASPTGRASAKLAQVTRQKATTLHRLLEFDPALRTFKRNAANKLVGSLFLVDEASSSCWRRSPRSGMAGAAPSGRSRRAASSVPSWSEPSSSARSRSSPRSN